MIRSAGAFAAPAAFKAFTGKKDHQHQSYENSDQR